MKRRIQHLIAETCGINPDSLSEKAWDKILRERLESTGSASLAAYHALLLRKEELQNLVERLTVQEGWFFRDRTAFDLLVHAANQKPHALRLLSMACSTGEEPYSMAMALAMANFPFRFQIDAVDINRSALSTAEKGLFTSHAFRGKSFQGLEHFFDKSEGLYHIKKEVRTHVSFSYGNICHASFLVGKPLYDIVFLRNVLFYLTPQAQKQVLQNCSKLLAKEGVLLVTPAEAPLVERHGFVQLEKGRSFMWQQPGIKRGIRRKAELARWEAPRIEKQEDEKPTEWNLQDAEELADSGKFIEAEGICRTWIEKNSMDASGHFLLGVIRHARGDEQEAEACFLKTLYLEPFHEAALTYVALLAERRGDINSAERYRRRLKKGKYG